MKNAMIILGLSLAAGVTFPACMHLMMGKHTMSNEHATVSLEKELLTEHLKLSISLSALTVGKQTSLVCQITNRKTGEPVDEATVYFESTKIDSITNNHQAHHQQEAETQKAQHEQGPLPSPQPGSYEAVFKPVMEGSYRLSFRVTSVGRQVIDPQIVLESIVTVGNHGSNHSGGMMNWTSMSIVGITAMGIMMIWMILR